MSTFTVDPTSVLPTDAIMEKKQYYKTCRMNKNITKQKYISSTILYVQA